MKKFFLISIFLVFVVSHLQADEIPQLCSKKKKTKVLNKIKKYCTKDNLKKIEEKILDSELTDTQKIALMEAMEKAQEKLSSETLDDE